MNSDRKQRILLQALSFFLAVVCFFWGSFQPAWACESARELLRAAYNNRYAWSSGFPGYTAEVAIESRGESEQVDRGTVTVKPDLSIEITDFENSNLGELVKDQMEWQVNRMFAFPFNDRFADSRLEIVETYRSGAVKIQELLDGEPFITYVVKDNTLAEIREPFTGVNISTETYEDIQTRDGYLVGKTISIVEKPEIAEGTSLECESNTYQKVGNYYLLKSHTSRYFTPQDLVKQPLFEIDITASNFKLL